MPSSEPFVRLADDGDLKTVLGLVEQLRAPGRSGSALSPSRAGELLARTDWDLLVCEEAGVVVGYALTVYTAVLRSATPVALLQELVVDCEHRGLGLGSALVDAAIGRAWAAGCGEVVVVTAGAGRFYEDRGFVRTASHYKLRRGGS